MNPRYLPFVSAINDKIQRFNGYLSEAHQIPTIQPEEMMKVGICTQVTHGDWHGFQFPRGTSRGVYLIFGYEKSDPTKSGVYIGKASFSSTIGKRLYSHFNRHRYSPFFEMNGYRGEPFILEFMIAIDLEELDLTFMASSLEEFLISELHSEILLMNGTGNWIAPAESTAI